MTYNRLRTTGLGHPGPWSLSTRGVSLGTFALTENLSRSGVLKCFLNVLIILMEGDTCMHVWGSDD